MFLAVLFFDLIEMSAEYDLDFAVPERSSTRRIEVLAQLTLTRILLHWYMTMTCTMRHYEIIDAVAILTHSFTLTCTSRCIALKMRYEYTTAKRLTLRLTHLAVSVCASRRYHYRYCCCYTIDS